MKPFKAILLTVLFILLDIFWGYELLDAIKQHWQLFLRWFNSAKSFYYPWYLWMGFGTIVFPLMNKYFVKNMEMTKIFTHELSHTIIGLLLFRRIHSFHAEEKGCGVVWSSGRDSMRFITSLAPYCSLIYTIPLLMIRSLVVKDYLPIIDIIIGFTLGLHGVCFKEQIGNHQPDINQYPLWFSYIYIISVWLFNVSLLLMAYLPKMNFFLVFRSYALDLFQLRF